MEKKADYVRWFKDVDKENIAEVGGKGANLGEMTKFAIPVPAGFVITSQAYFDFLDENRLMPLIKRALALLDVNDPASLGAIAVQIQRLILSGKISPLLAGQIVDNYLKLGGLFKEPLVAVRSSATAEDLPTASFAGQQKTFLNVKGKTTLLEAVKRCWASLFEQRAIFYRQEKGFDHFHVGLAAIIQEMVDSEVSGVMFTIDPVTNQKNRIVVEAIWGLGEYIVQGEVTPDRYLVDSHQLEIIKKEISKQTFQLLKVDHANRKVPVPKSLQLKRKLADPQIIELAKIGRKIHRHYFFPQDIEWALSGGKFFIVQTRPVTTIKETETGKEKELPKRKLILSGTGASPGLASGPVVKIKTAREIGKVARGNILVTPMTSPDYVPAMKRAAAIITDKGGQTSHAAIVSRELGIPCVVGTEEATKILKNGQIVTVDGAKGVVYQGGIVSGTKEVGPSFISDNRGESTNQLITAKLKTATRLYVNLAEPDLAESVAKRNIDGVGLLRAEFMIANIGVHPKKLLKERKQKVFIEEMTDNLSKICEQFFPRPVVYRATDFKTNEYRYLTGGKAFEPEEENPFIGYRGAFRYLTDPQVFKMEITVIRQVRKKYHNLWLMIPFVHLPQEMREVKKLLAKEGLIRSHTFQLWMMVEIPSNAILLEDFLKVGIDGVSIGSNDLTMLTLGVDRDNAALKSVFNEMNPAVLSLIEQTIKICRKNDVTSSICGQAPSIYSALVEKLVGWGITSISVNPDVIERTREIVYEAEKRRLTKLD